MLQRKKAATISKLYKSTAKSQKAIIIAMVSLVLIVLFGIIIFLFIKLRETESKTDAAVPCLDSGICIVGVSFDDKIPGFRVKNGKEYFGFDIYMANELTQHLGRDDPVIVQADRDDSLTDPNKPVHMYISTVSMTDNRLDKMIFVGPYMRTFQGVMVVKDSPIRSRTDLDHKAICVASDTTSKEGLDTYAATHPIEVRTEATTEQCIEAAKRGSHDAVTSDYIALQTHAHADESLRVLPEVRLSSGYELYGIALPKNSLALCEKLKPLVKNFIREKWDTAFSNNLKNLGITYDPSNTTIPSLKPGENLIDVHSCKQKPE